MNRYLTEFIGTFFLVFTIGLAANGLSGLIAPLAIGGALMIMVYMGGHISGAHYNPAVTLAVCMRGKLPAGDILPYWIAQFAGALAAGFLASFIIARAAGVAPPSDDLGRAVLIEAIFTFALALVVLHVATAKANAGNSYFGFAIGLTVTVAAYVGGPISGGAFNPAVGLGLNVVHAVVEKGAIAHAWIYAAGPFAGAALAAMVFRAQIGRED